MPKTRQQKVAIAEGLKEKLDNMKSVIFVNFSGIPIKEINKLRYDCKEQGVNYSVAKKTILKRVLAEKNVADYNEGILEGEVAAVFGLEDEIVPAKLIDNFAKEQKNMKIVAGILEGKLLNSAQVMALAKLPSKPELFAKVVGSIASPLSGFVNVLQGNLRGLVCALNAIKEKKA